MTAPAPRRRRIRLLLTAAAVLAAGGYFVSRHLSRSADRRAALVLAEGGKPADALAALHKALEHSPDDPQLLAAVVRVMTSTGAPVPDVEPFVERWCRASPDDLMALKSKLDMLKRLTRHEEAAGVAVRILELSPHEHAVRSTLAGTYLTIGRFDDAAREFRHLLESSPLPRADLKVGLARALDERGDPAAAGKLLDEALAESPDYPPAVILRGVMHFKLGEYGAAVEKLSRARADTQHHREIVLYHLALCFDRLGKAEDSKKARDLLAAVQTARAFREDASQRPDDVALQVRSAEALLASDQTNLARGDLDAALSRIGPNKSLLLALAKCYDKLGEPARAKAARDRAANTP